MRPNIGTSDYLLGMKVTTSIAIINGESVLRTYGLVNRMLPEVCISRNVSDSICEATITMVVREWRTIRKIIYGEHYYTLGPDAFVNVLVEKLGKDPKLVIIRQQPRSLA